MEPDPIALDDQLCFPLYTAARLMTRAYNEALGVTGLTYPQYLVMLVLWEDGPLSMRDLGHRLALDSGTLTPLLKRLETSGVVRRARDEDDERRVIVTVTDQGLRLAEQVHDVPDRIRAACGLSDDAVDQLKGLLESLTSSLDEHLSRT